MAFSDTIPQASDKLIQSQQDLLANNAQLQVSFNQDHYGFTDATANNGKHRQITTPDLATNPATLANEPKLYGTSLTGTNLGVLQYSRAGSDAVPTPITSIQGTTASLAASSSVAILDFAGIQNAYGELWATGSGASYCYASFFFRFGSFNTTSFTSSGSSSNTIISGRFNRPTASGTQLQLVNLDASNAITDIRWTICFKRVELS